MSDVRMCDRCGDVFSLLADGWQTYTATTVKKVAGSSKRETVTVQLDACPACAMNVDEPASVQRADDQFFARKQLEQENAKLRDELAKQAGVVDGDATAVDEPEPATAEAAT